MRSFSFAAQVLALLLALASSSNSELADETTFLCTPSSSSSSSSSSTNAALYDNDTSSSSSGSSSSSSSKNNKNNNWHWRGTNLGGHLVLEPWITPSLFYQFLGPFKKWGEDTPKHVAFDSYSFCDVLGSVEANRQLRQHWAAWVTDAIVAEIASTGVDTVRLPVGDWLFVPYAPYIDCFSGGLEELDRVIQLCKKHGLAVLLDVHAIKGSQNSFDNSGRAIVEWTSPTSFIHIATAGWLGKYNLDTQETEFNQDGFYHALDVVQRIIDRYKDETAVIGIEPVNEPWYFTPMDKLKLFYAKVYNLVQNQVPHWVSVFHDAFHPVRYAWNDFLKGCDNFAFDTHSYQAWRDVSTSISYSQVACAIGRDLSISEDAGIPMIVGEWSLAADNCAMWLNGFNDQIATYPKTKCDMVKCSDIPPYMGENVQPGAPPDPSMGGQEPYGAGGYSSPVFGYCPVGATFIDGEDRGMTAFAHSQLQAFEVTHAQFMWNFRTELEPRWSFLEAHRRGWLPSLMDDSTIAQIGVCDTNLVYNVDSFYEQQYQQQEHDADNANVDSPGTSSTDGSSTDSSSTYSSSSRQNNVDNDDDKSSSSSSSSPPVLSLAPKTATTTTHEDGGFFSSLRKLVTLPNNGSSGMFLLLIIVLSVASLAVVVSARSYLSHNGYGIGIGASSSRHAYTPIPSTQHPL